MDFRTFCELKDWTLEDVVEKLRATSEPPLAGVNASVVSKHLRGTRFPNPGFIKAYTEITEGAVTWPDWVALKEKVKAGAVIPRKPRKKKAPSEHAAAAAA